MPISRPSSARAAFLAVLATSFGRMPAATAAEEALPGPYFCPEEIFEGQAPPPRRRAPIDPKAPIDVETDAFDHTVEGETLISGQVEVTQGDRRIKADQVRLNTETRQMHVEGSIEYSDP